MEPVVLEHGSAQIRAGYANPDNDPPLVFSSAACQVDSVGKPMQPSHGPANGQPARLPEAGAVHPVQRGVIVDWDVMEDLWRYILYNQVGWELGNEGQILIAEPTFTSKATRERLVQLMFEDLNVAGLYCAEQSLLSLYALGRLTGCVVDIGHGKIEIAPILEGAVIYNALKTLEIGGQDLSALLGRQLAERHPESRLDPAEVQKIKEEHCEVPLNHDVYDASAADWQSVEYTLPDGQVIALGRERLALGEALFQPSILGSDEPGLVEQVLQCVLQCVPSESQKAVMESVVLVGGTATMKGLDTRFLADTTLAAPPSLRPSLLKVPDYMPDATLKNAAWMGGAILAKVVFSQNQHISKAEYDETGPIVVHKKCS